MLVAAVDHDPRLAARALCDQHVRKLILESVQILDSGSRHLAALRGVEHVPVVKVPRSQVNNPICKLAMYCDEWWWIFSHACSLMDEFSYRFLKRHAWDHQDLLSHLARRRSRLLEVRSGSDQPLFRVTDGRGLDFPLREAVPLMREVYADTKLTFAGRAGRRETPATWTLRGPPRWLIDAARLRGLHLVTAGRSGHSVRFSN